MREFSRSQRVADLMHHEVSTILLMDIKDPRIEMVTVTGVTVTDDLRHATVFYSVIGDEKRWKEVKQGLPSSKGFMKKELGRRVRMKYIPDIKFIEDRTLEQGERMDAILSGLADEGGHEGKD